MTGVGLFLMLSSFLYYLIRSRGGSELSGRSRAPLARVAVTFIVMLSWLGGMALLLMFAPIDTTRQQVAAQSHSYLLAFSCLFVLIVFVALRGIYESSKKSALDDIQVAKSISTALERFEATPTASSVRQSYVRSSSSEPPRAGLSTGKHLSSGIELTSAELLVLARDAEVRVFE